jgi:hypothetical protein
MNQDPVPSVVMANYILNSENKIELVRGLIEDKRALSFEVDELEGREKAQTLLINHLLQRITELGNKHAEMKKIVNQ